MDRAVRLLRSALAGPVLMVEEAITLVDYHARRAKHKDFKFPTAVKPGPRRARGRAGRPNPAREGPARSPRASG